MKDRWIDEMMLQEAAEDEELSGDEPTTRPVQYKTATSGVRHRHNVPLPLAARRRFLNVDNQAVMVDRGLSLLQYRGGQGLRRLAIPWITKRMQLGEVPLTVLDYETTGIDPERDRIIQAAYMRVRPDFTIDWGGSVNQLVHPGFTRDGEAIKIAEGAIEQHGITIEDLEDAPQMEEVLPQWREGQGVFKRNALPVTYNGDHFDIPFVQQAIVRYNKSDYRKSLGARRLPPADPAISIDVYMLIMRLHPYVSMGKKLGDHYKVLMGQELLSKHDAVADSVATLDLLKYVHRYLQKHTLPLPWAKAAEDMLKRRIPDWDRLERLDADGLRARIPNWDELHEFNENWDNLDADEKKKRVSKFKTATIAGFVRKHRAAFERMKPGGESAGSIRVLDLLDFQQGGKVLHEVDDELTYYPALDIVLNHKGVDTKKVWDATDVLDPEIVESVRTERAAENRALLTRKFETDFPSDNLLRLTEAFCAATQGRVTKKGTEEMENALMAAMTRLAVACFMNNVLVVDSTVESRVAQLREPFKELILSVLPNSMRQMDGPQLQALGIESGAIDDLAKDAMDQILRMRKEMGRRTFYSYQPVTKPVIDPNVYESARRAKEFEERTAAMNGGQPHFGMVTPIAHLRRPRPEAPGRMLAIG